MLAERLIGKKVAFNKKGDTRTFIGILKEVTNESIVIDFEGRMQIHELIDIRVMEEGSKDV